MDNGTPSHSLPGWKDTSDSWNAGSKTVWSLALEWDLKQFTASVLSARYHMLTTLDTGRMGIPFSNRG
ncbi:hypothetical protein E6O75_ATG02404 [Venturia nashicola]|uniref:Uncharacterized protein n=1 Tax=Venturia nashicola TaxID=86259 RepID=A0A4Z1PAB9_9PEZI|nr:hypothetical protein E6O75_ATG02404 [Venturia nashicola]